MPAEKPTHVAYELKVRDDGLASVTLSTAHRQFLIYLGQHGGETMMDWDAAEAMRTSEVESRKETVKEHLFLMKPMGLISERILIGGNRSLVRLTDIGRNVLTQILADKS